LKVQRRKEKQAKQNYKNYMEESEFRPLLFPNSERNYYLSSIIKTTK
jgi:hypothetical protein